MAKFLEREMEFALRHRIQIAIDNSDAAIKPKLEGSWGTLEADEMKVQVRFSPGVIRGSSFGTERKRGVIRFILLENQSQDPNKARVDEAIEEAMFIIESGDAEGKLNSDKDIEDAPLWYSPDFKNRKGDPEPNRLQKRITNFQILSSRIEIGPEDNESSVEGIIIDFQVDEVYDPDGLNAER